MGLIPNDPGDKPGDVRLGLGELTMIHIPIVASLLLVLLTLLAGCASNSGPLRATWDYTELTKDNAGKITETGPKRSFRSGGDEMYEIKGKTLEVVTVTSAKAMFRLSSSDTAEKKEVEIQPDNSHDLWMNEFVVRLRVEKIGPIP